MKVKITSKGGYRDRFGEFHEFGTIADLPDPIALKLLHHGIAEAVRIPVEVTRPISIASRPMAKRGRPKVAK